MKEAERIGVSLSPKLLEKFDDKIEDKMYTNRSEAIRDLIRDFLAKEEIKTKGEVVGTLTIIYNHEIRGISEKLIDLQHNSESEILSSMHIHLDEKNCMEVLSLKGNAENIKKTSEKLLSSKGVKHGKLFLSSVNKL